MAAGKLSKFVVGVSSSKLNLVGKRERASAHLVQKDFRGTLKILMSVLVCCNFRAVKT